MDITFELELIGRAASPDVVRKGSELANRAVELVEREGTRRESLVHGTPTHVVTWEAGTWPSAVMCTCGGAQGDQLCAHAIAARLRHLHTAGGIDSGQWARFLSRVDALVALSTGWEGLAQFVVDSHAAGEPDASFIALRDAGSTAGGLRVARALVAAGEPAEVVSDFLVALSEDRGLDGQAVAGPAAISAAEELVVELGGHLEYWPHGASAAALLRLIGSLRRAATDPAESPSPFWALTIACSAVGRLVVDDLVDPDVVAMTLLDAESESEEADYPWIAVMLDRVGGAAPAVARAMLQRLGEQHEAQSIAHVNHALHRARAEAVHAAADENDLLEVLENWPAAPYGEYFVRLPQSWSPRRGLELLKAARAAGCLRWAPGWPRHNPVDPHGGRLIHQLHDTFPGHPMWGDIAVGDLVTALSRIGETDHARTALIEHAHRHQDPSHRAEFRRIWAAAHLGTGVEAAADEIFGRRDGDDGGGADADRLLEAIANVPEALFCADLSVRRGIGTVLITAVLLEDLQLSPVARLAAARSVAADALALHPGSADDLVRLADADIEEMVQEAGEFGIAGAHALQRAHRLARAAVHRCNSLATRQAIERHGISAWVDVLRGLPDAGTVIAGLVSLLLGGSSCPADATLKIYFERALGQPEPHAAGLIEQAYAVEPRGGNIEEYHFALILWELAAGDRRS
ncbi:hypothetical protein [Brachybacterium sp. NPDC056505]|uniref:hypothetical protein n=1 Tax=Brachybacterium sp. NPDC056505 TaxID=3345843 RepID=UPI00366CFC24